MPLTEIALVALVGSIWLVGAVLALLAAREHSARSKQLERWARHRGLAYDEKLADSRCGFYHVRLEILSGNEIGASNLCSGKINGLEVIAFDYPQRGDFSRGGHSIFSALLIRPGFGLRAIFVRPKRIAPVVRASSLSLKQSMDTESAEFNAAFELRATDRRWALDFLSPRSMELMMWHQEEFGIESDGEYLAVFSDRPLEPEGFERACDFGMMLLDAIPPHARLAPVAFGERLARGAESADPW